MARVPQYRKHPNGQAFVHYRGRRYYLGKHGSDKSVDRYKRFIARIELGQEPPIKELELGGMRERTIVEMIVLYREHAEVYYSKDGRPTKEFRLMMDALRRLEALHGDTLAVQFGPRALIALQDALIGLGYSRKVLNHHIGRVKRFFRWCCQQELLPHALYHGLLCVNGLQKGRSKARETAPVRPVSREWVEKTLPYLTPTVAAMVEVQLLCGMRPGEVCAMRGGDLNMAGDIWIYSPPDHKNAWRDTKRFVAIPRKAQTILRPFLKADLQAPLFSPRESEQWRNARRVGKAKPDRKTPIYPSELRARAKRRAAARRRASNKREAYDTDSYRRAIAYGIRKAEQAGEQIPHWHPHQLRHSISTEISQAIGQQAAQRWLGHEHLETTEIYSEKQVSELIEIARELDRRWAS